MTEIRGEKQDRASQKFSFPDWTPRQVFTATLVVLMVLAGFWLLYRYRLVAFGMFEAIVFGTAIRPAVSWFERRGLPRAVGAAGVFLLVVLALAGVVLLFIPLLTEQGSTITRTLADMYQGFRQALMTSPNLLITRLALYLPTTLVISPAAPSPAGSTRLLDQMAVILQYSMQILHGAFTALMVLLLTFYWAIDHDRLVRSILIFFPSEQRDPAREFIEASEAKVGSYLRGLAIMCATIGALSLISYMIIGLPYAVPLAIVAGLLEAVPLIGPILGAAPAVLVALALDPSKILWVIVGTVIIQQLENHILVPRVMNQSVGVNPVISLLAFVIFSSLFGIAGALLAVPLAATLQLVFYRTMIEAPETAPVGRDTISVLRYEAQELIQDVRKQVRQKETTIEDPSDQVEDAIEAIVNDLDLILARAEKLEIDAKAMKEGQRI